MARQSQNIADLGMAEKIVAEQSKTKHISADLCSADLRRSEADHADQCRLEQCRSGESNGAVGCLVVAGVSAAREGRCGREGMTTTMLERREEDGSG